MSTPAKTHLSLFVSDLEQAVDFYGKLLGMEPSKLRPGYANFASEDPPLKLALQVDAERAGQINHLGIEVVESASITAAANRLAGEGLQTVEEINTTCCYAVQDKVWVADPDGANWEVYAVLANSPTESNSKDCCQPEATADDCCATTESAQGCCVAT